MDREKAQEILSIMESLDKDLYNKTKKVMESLSDKQLLKLFGSKQWKNYIYSIGVENALKETTQAMGISILSTINDYSNFITAERVTQVKRNANLLRESKILTMKGMVDSSIQTMSTQLTSSVLLGTKPQDILSQLSGIPLSTSQLNSFVNTSFSNISREVTHDAFKDKPKQKYYYDGMLIDTSSDQCRWLMRNQRKEGYTMEEIKAGIQTPHGAINWYGRQPNFNCLHGWFPFDYDEKVSDVTVPGVKVKMVKKPKTAEAVISKTIAEDKRVHLFNKNLKEYKSFGKFYDKRFYDDTTFSTKTYSKKYNLTKDNVNTIDAYTGSAYGDINQYLQGTKKFTSSETKIFNSYIDNLNASLDKLPDYNGVTYRLERFALERYKNIEIGNTIRFDSFCSTGKGGSSFIKGKKGSEDVFFHIKSKFGKKIERFSDYTSEKEVLFKSESKFKVQNIIWSEGKPFTIYMEEV